MRFKFGNLVRFVGDRRNYNGISIPREAIGVVLKHYRKDNDGNELQDDHYSVELVFKHSIEYSDYVRPTDIELVV